MTRREYEHLQERLSVMKDSKRLFSKGISGKRKEGYEAAILAVKSMLKDEFYSQEDHMQTINR